MEIHPILPQMAASIQPHQHIPGSPIIFRSLISNPTGIRRVILLFRAIVGLHNRSQVILGDLLNPKTIITTMTIGVQNHSPMIARKKILIPSMVTCADQV
jgi:hypothetical protein